MKFRALALAAPALALAIHAAPAPAQTSACRVDGPRCITVAFHETEMRDVAATFVEFSGTSIVLGQGVEGRVTAEIRNQPWDVALGAILQAHGLAARPVAPGVLRVDPIARIAASEAAEPLATRVFRLNYARAPALAQTLEAVRSARGSIAVSEEANALVVTDTEAVLATMARLIGHPAQ